MRLPKLGFKRLLIRKNTHFFNIYIVIGSSKKKKVNFAQELNTKDNCDSIFEGSSSNAT